MHPGRRKPLSVQSVLQSFLSPVVTALLILLFSRAGLGAEPPAEDVGKVIAELRAEIAALRADYERRIADLEKAHAEELAAATGAPSPAPTPAEAELVTVPAAPANAGAAAPAPPVEEGAAELAAAAEAAAAAATAGAPSGPPPLIIASGAGGKNFLNLSLDALLAAGSSTASDVGSLQLGGHDPIQRGFTLQNVETVFEGAVDPYFRGQANVILQIDADGETVVELEEVYLTSTSLPMGLQVKAGQFFTEFGRLNPSHPHTWDFVDQPLVNGRLFGPDGLRSVGARLSWLMPTNFYSEAMLAVQNGHGETLSSFGSVPGETLFGVDIERRDVSSFSDLLIAPRYTASFDLSDTQTLLLGASAALGPNGTGSDGETRIYGADAFWKWKPTNAFRGFPFLKIQGELMRRSAAVELAPDEELPRATFVDWGGYLHASWGFRPGYVAGLRLDRVGGDQGIQADPNLAPRWRLSPALTWFPTEYSKLRLQYNFDSSNAFRGDEHSLWLQTEFLLGAHAAHKF